MLNKNLFILAAILSGTALLLNGCGSNNTGTPKNTFVYGTAAYGRAHDNDGIDPHVNYQGWSAIRYGVGETLFRFDGQMQPQPWLAQGFAILDDYTMQIVLKPGIKFSSGRALDAAAVKECLEDLLARHNRAAHDLQLLKIQADGQVLTLTSKVKVAVLLNYLCDPYGCIIDMHSDKLSGTGPYIIERQTPKEIHLRRNPNYWNGPAKLEKVIVKGIIDGDTLTMAMQSGELDAAQGLPYNSIKLFQNQQAYSISSVNTSRLFQCAFNMQTPALQDLRVRQAIAMSIDKEQFTKTILQGNGTPAAGPFPSNLPFGSDRIQAHGYNPAKAKQLLQEAGWRDSDGDGYVDKNGQNLELRWLTYTSRQELPPLAVAAQAFLKEIGIKVTVNATEASQDFLNRGQWDIYAKAFVAAPTGDPQYYFTTHVLDSSAYNNGRYHSDRAEQLTEQLRNEFNPQKRSELAQQISQQLLDDQAFFYIAHLRMNLVTKSGVHGLTAHPSDYYEITNQLRKD